ncbi:recombinase family protein [Klebsiella aerogenes]|uniref:recombinase family protein n=3 Tax=Klebsiella aerogenes TaxID=548 RepID=UPI0037BCE230
MIKTFIYSRVSSQEQLSGGGLDRQEQDIKNYIQNNGLDKHEIVEMVDRGISAFDGSNLREGELGKWYQEAITGIYWGSHLVVEAIDRVSRKKTTEAMEDILRLMNKGGIQIHLVRMNLIVNNNPIILSVYSQLANEESQQKSERIAKGWKRRRDIALATGTVITERTPYWIDIENNQYKANKHTVTVLKAFNHYKSGLSCGLIAKKLNEDGEYFPYMWTKLSVQKVVDGLGAAGVIDVESAIDTIMGLHKNGMSCEDIAKDMNANHNYLKEWNTSSVHKLLQNRSVTGLVEIQKNKMIDDIDSYGRPIKREKEDHERIYEMVYEQIITIDDFEIIQKLLSSNRKVKDSVGNSHTTSNGDGEYVKNSIFSTICRCGKCGGAMYNNIVNARRSNGKIDTYNYLRCINENSGICDTKSMNYSVLEKGIIQHIKGLNFDTLVKSDNNSELELLRLQEVELLRDVAFYDEKIKTAKAAGKKVNPTYREGIAEAEEALDEVQAKIAALRDIHINVEELVSVNESIFDTSEYELRNAIEGELQKLIERLEFHHIEKNKYSVDIHYRGGNTTFHRLGISKKEGVYFVLEVGKDGSAYTSHGDVIMEEDKKPMNINTFKSTGIL